MKVFRARTVVTMCSPPIDDGAIGVEEGVIVAVGRWRDIRREVFGSSQPGPQIEDVGECVLLPGFINCHCHLDYTALKGLIPPQETFTKWITAINALKRKGSDEGWVRSIESGMEQSRRWGTRTILNIAAFPSVIPRVTGMGLRVYWMVEMIDLFGAIDPELVLAEVRGQSNQSLHVFGLSPHAPYTASRSLYLACERLARGWGVPVTTHVAESAEEEEMFARASGPLYDFMQKNGRSMTDCGDGSPFFHLVRAGKLRAPWLVAHANWLEKDSAEAMAAAGMTIVHCPRTHEYFRRAPFPLQAWRDAGVRVCVGTDSLASNEDLSLLAELRQFRKTHPTIDADALLAMITRDAAGAVGMAGRLGLLTPGALADLVKIPFDGSLRDALESVIWWPGDVAWVE